MKKGFNFSVIVFPSGETLNQELSFIKAAVLYADQVNLISPSIWNFLQRYQYACYYLLPRYGFRFQSVGRYIVDILDEYHVGVYVDVAPLRLAPPAGVTVD